MVTLTTFIPFSDTQLPILTFSVRAVTSEPKHHLRNNCHHLYFGTVVSPSLFELEVAKKFLVCRMTQLSKGPSETCQRSRMPENSGNIQISQVAASLPTNFILLIMMAGVVCPVSRQGSFFS